MIEYVFLGIYALLLGSFFNVVIYRLPVMMRRDWKKQSSDYLQALKDEEAAKAAEQIGVQGKSVTSHGIHNIEENAVFNLAVPRSKCGECGTPIKWYQNLPVLSYLLLRGKCGACSTKISLRYPLVELITAVLAIVVVAQFGWSYYAAALVLFTWALLILTLIDFDTQLLPDSITLPMLWLGLLVNMFLETPVTVQDAVLGAVGGYLILWSVYWLFKLTTGKEGMGYGDFKLLAMMGAWLGWQYLPLMIILSAGVGMVLGGLLIVIDKSRNTQTQMPFGPYLACAGWIALLYGASINQWYLSVAGLL